MTLGKEIIFVLIIKIVLLLVIWDVWFDSSMTDDQAALGVNRVILNR